MFNSTLRRAAQTCPGTALAARQSPSTTCKASATFSTRCHQRRYSSSKPPTPPNNGSTSIPATSVKQVGGPRSTDKRPGAESRLSKRKAAKGDKAEQTKVEDAKSHEWTLKLPSVPSTQHLTPKDVYLASFFSTHRPISISGPLPPEIQLEEFDKIFQSRPKKAKKSNPSDVIYTLNNAVQNLDEAIQNPQQDSIVEQKADLIKALTQSTNNHHVQHLDGQPQGQNNIRLVIQDLANRFKPFNAPPAPVPVPELEFYAKQEEQSVEAEFGEEMQARQLEKEVESQDQGATSRSPAAKPQHPSLSSGSFFTPHQTMMSAAMNSARASAVQRIRRKVYADPTRSWIDMRYELISVKRQRKLKMKKHKYKKLMRKTRNLRRRQDKL